MKLSQTKKAIDERRRRVANREKRRRTLFVHDYVRVKYEVIFSECNRFYQELAEKYPAKLDFTKTAEYKKWERRTKEGSKSVAETIMLEPYIPLVNIFPKPSTGNFEQAEREADSSVGNFEQAEREADSSVGNFEQAEREADTNGNFEQVEREADTNGNFEQVEREADTDGNFGQAEPSILQAAVQEFVPDNPVSIEDMDRIIDQMVRDLQQDEQVRDLLGNLEEEDIEEDEGIELNIESELAAIVEPLDYVLEVEGVDW